MRFYGRRQPRNANSGDTSVSLDAAEAWKAVGLVNEWVRHAETKAAATLAAAGVIAGVLYNLVKDQLDIDRYLAVAASSCGVLAIWAAVCAFAALWPRLRSKEEPTSPLYFDHIARRHPKGSKLYAEELKRLLASPEKLLEELAHQVWANARIARRKYRWAAWGAVSAMGAALALGATALKLGLASVGVK